VVYRSDDGPKSGPKLVTLETKLLCMTDPFQYILKGRNCRNDSENGSLWECYIQALWDFKLCR